MDPALSHILMQDPLRGEGDCWMGVVVNKMSHSVDPDLMPSSCGRILAQWLVTWTVSIILHASNQAVLQAIFYPGGLVALYRLSSDTRDLEITQSSCGGFSQNQGLFGCAYSSGGRELVWCAVCSELRPQHPMNLE